MSKAVRFIVLLFVLAFGMAHAANFSNKTNNYLQITGSTAKYTLAPSNYGGVAFPNTPWQILGASVARGVELGKSQNLPLPINGSLPALIKAEVPLKSVSRALTFPWPMIAGIALQEVLGIVADQACVRIAGGQMMNTGGLWEECITKIENRPVYTCNGPWTGVSGSGLTPQEAAENCLPPGSKDPWGNIYLKFSYIVENTCGNGCHSVFYTRQLYNSTATELVAPFGMYSNMKDVPVKDWRAVPTDQAESRIDNLIHSNPDLAKTIFSELFNQGADFQDVGNVTVTGPETVNVGSPITTTRTNPDGSTETLTQQYVRNYTYNGDSVTHVSTTVTTVNNSVVNNVNNSTTTVTTISPENQQNQEIQTCGLPGKPACKIDEAGTPEADSLDQSKVDQAFTPIKTCLQNPISCLPSLPDFNWTFSLPSGCSPIPLTGFTPFIESIDICRFQPVFHDLMSMVWAAVGLFMAAGMMFREANGG